MKLYKIPSLIYVLALAIIIGFVFILRFFNLTNNPPGFFCDEASIGYNAYSILTTGHDEHGAFLPVYFEAFGEYKSPVFVYSTIPFIRLFGLNEFSVRLTAAVFGVLAILAIYLMTKELFNKKIAMISSFFLAISPWHIHLSRIAFELITSTFLIPFSIYLLYKSRSNIKFYPFAVFFMILSFLSYSVAKIYYPILVIFFFLFYFDQIQKLLNNKWFWFFSFIGIFLAYYLISPYISNGSFLARWNQVVMKDINIKTLTHGYINHFSLDFLFNKGDIDFPGQFITRHSIRGIGQLFWFQLPLILIGLVSLFSNNKNRRAILLILLLLALYPLGSIFSTINPQATRSVIGVIPFQILTALGLYQICLKLKNHNYLEFFFKIFSSVIIFVSIGYLAILFFKYPLYSADYWGWQYGPKEAVLYFLKNINAYDEFYLTGKFNAPEIFLKFYAPDNKCFKCKIGSIENYKDNLRQIFAVSADEYNAIENSFVVNKKISYPDGSPAFYIGTFKKAGINP